MITSHKELIQDHVSDKMGPRDIRDKGREGEGRKGGHEDINWATFHEEGQGGFPMVETSDIRRELWYNNVGKTFEERANIHVNKWVGGCGGWVVPRSARGLVGRVPELRDNIQNPNAKGSAETPSQALVTKAVDDIQDT